MSRLMKTDEETMVREKDAFEEMQGLEVIW